jgi:hypothetical protein
MTYLLRKMSSEDKNKVIGVCEEGLKNRLSSLFSFKEPPTTFWVVDDSEESFIFISPPFGPEDGLSLQYYFYFKHRMFFLQIDDGWFGNDIKLVRGDTSVIHDVQNFEEHVIRAARILGRNGDGVVNDPNSYSFNPAFNIGV